MMNANLQGFRLWFGMLLLALISAPARVFCQSTFQNLDFESVVQPIPVGFVPTTNALPGWAASPYGDSEPVTQNGFVLYNLAPLDASGVAVLGPGYGSGNLILHGDYSVLLAGSTDGANPASASIGQTGQIPPDAQSLVFFSKPLTNFQGAFVGEPVFQVTFSGQAIQLVQIGSTTDYDVMSGDISRFAGQTGELLFTALRDHVGVLDNIQLIPEPSGLELFGMGILLVAGRSFKKWS